MKHIGIVGAGVAGLQLGLYLRQQGIDATMYSEYAAEAQYSSRLPALVVRSGATRARERALGVNHWDDGANEFSRIHIRLSGEQSLSFVGELPLPFIGVDMRVYYGRLLEDFVACGGRSVVGGVRGGDLDQLAEKHDLLVVATGRSGLMDVFPRREEFSPYTEPQRHLFIGFFYGVTAVPLSSSITFVPGHGEIFEFPMYTLTPHVTGLGVEAVPGGAFDTLVHARYADDPQGFKTMFLEVLREHVPNLYERIDREAFRLTRALDFAQGGVTPVVRQGYARLAHGRYALALGDVFATHDPVTGQGANTASYAARLLGEAICASSAGDEAFCQDFERRIWEYTAPVVAWTNAMLQPPPQHVIDLLIGAAQNQAIADRFVSFFEYPQQAWDLISSPERTQALLSQHAIVV